MRSAEWQRFIRVFEDLERDLETQINGFLGGLTGGHSRFPEFKKKNEKKLSACVHNCKCEMKS